MRHAETLNPVEAPGTTEQCQKARERLAENALDLDDELYLARMLGLM